MIPVVYAIPTYELRSTPAFGRRRRLAPAAVAMLVINQNVVINGSNIIDTSDKVWIVQNGKYLTYPKIDREQTWNFSLILSIFYFKCKILNKKATING